MARVVLGIAVAVTAIALPLLGQRCPVTPATRPFRQVVSSSIAHFEWYSAYASDPNPGYGSDFDRYVRNLGHALLKYDWPVGGMYNFALQPEHEDTLCVNYGRPNSVRGPLYYGRMNAVADSSVWEGEGEPRSGQILSRFSFSSSERNGDPQVVITLMSKYDGERYLYRLQNISHVTVRISWHAGAETNMLQELQEHALPSFRLLRSEIYGTGERPSRLRITDEIRKGRTLEPRQLLMFDLGSTSHARVVLTHLDVGSLDARPLAGAILPILAPER
jgi:hypothetical protein